MNSREAKLEAFGRLLDIMDTLREECPWDRKQTLESLRHLTIEETYELADAIEGSRHTQPELFPNGWLNPSTTLGRMDFDHMPLVPFDCTSEVRTIIDVVRNYDPAAAGDVTFTSDYIVETIKMQAFANLPATCVMEPCGNLIEFQKNASL